MAQETTENWNASANGIPYPQFARGRERYAAGDEPVPETLQGLIDARAERARAMAEAWLHHQARLDEATTDAERDALRPEYAAAIAEASKIHAWEADASILPEQLREDFDRLKAHEKEIFDRLSLSDLAREEAEARSESENAMGEHDFALDAARAELDQFLTARDVTLSANERAALYGDYDERVKATDYELMRDQAIRAWYQQTLKDAAADREREETAALPIAQGREVNAARAAADADARQAQGVIPSTAPLRELRERFMPAVDRARMKELDDERDRLTAERDVLPEGRDRDRSEAKIDDRLWEIHQEQGAINVRNETTIATQQLNALRVETALMMPDAIEAKAQELRLKAETLRGDVAEGHEVEAKELERQAAMWAQVAKESAATTFEEVKQDRYAWQYEPTIDLLQASRWQPELRVPEAVAEEIRDQTYPGDHTVRPDEPRAATIVVGVASPEYLGRDWQMEPNVTAYGEELQNNRDFRPIGRSEAIGAVARDVAWPVDAGAMVLSDDVYRDLRRNHDDVAIEQGALTYLAFNAQNLRENQASVERTAAHHRSQYPERDFTASNDAIVGELARATEAAADRRHRAELQSELNGGERMYPELREGPSPRVRIDLERYGELADSVAFAEAKLFQEGLTADEKAELQQEVKDAQADLQAWAKERGVTLPDALEGHVTDRGGDGRTEQGAVESSSEVGAAAERDHKAELQRHLDRDESVKDVPREALSPRLQVDLAQYSDLVEAAAIADANTSQDGIGVNEMIRLARAAYSAEADLQAWAKERGVTVPEARLRQANDLDRDGQPDQFDEATAEREHRAELQLHLDRDESVKDKAWETLSPAMQHDLEEYSNKSERVAYAAANVRIFGEDPDYQFKESYQAELQDAEKDLEKWAQEKRVRLPGADVEATRSAPAASLPSLAQVVEQSRAAQAEHSAAALESAHKWTVQRYDEDRGVYVDKLHTNDVVIAHDAFRSGVEYRVIDNAIKDYAADYIEREVAGDQTGATHYEVDLHERSSFKAELTAVVAQDLARTAEFERDLRADPQAIDNMVTLAQTEREQAQLRDEQLNQRYVEVRGPDTSSEYRWRTGEEFARDFSGEVKSPAVEQSRYHVEQSVTNAAGDLAHETTLRTDSADEALQAFRAGSDLRVREQETGEIVATVEWGEKSTNPVWTAQEEFRREAAAERMEEAREGLSYRQVLQAEEELAEKVAAMEARTELMAPAEREKLEDLKLELQAMGEIAARDMWSITGDELVDPDFDGEKDLAAAAHADAFNAEMQQSGDPLKAERAAELAYDAAHAANMAQVETPASTREMSDRWVNGVQKDAPAEVDGELAIEVARTVERQDQRAAEAAALAGRDDPTALTLKQVLEREAELVGQVATRSDAIADVVDRIRDDRADVPQVARDYEAAARSYAAASQELRDFEAKPTSNAVVLETYRELKAYEEQAATAMAEAANAAIDGNSAKNGTAQDDADRALGRRDELLTRNGLQPEQYPPVQRERNTIERGLTPEQIAAVMGGPGEQARKEPQPQPERAEREGKAQAAQVVAKAAEGQREGHNQVRDFSALNDAQAKDKLVPAEVEAAFKRDPKDPSRFLDPADPKRTAFQDKGNRLSTSRTYDDKAVEAMVQTADARGWTEITVKGDEAFRRRAWLEATSRGIEVKGYTPSEQDIQRADQLAKQTGHGNAIEKNETLEAFRAARDGTAKEKREAAKKHPELVNAFAFEQAAKSFAKQRLAPDAVAPFVAAARVTVERDLAQGKAVPEIRKRQEPERRQERGVER